MSRFRWLALLAAAGLAPASQDFQELQKKITEFTLPNGMRFLVAERRGAPLIAFRTLVGVGSASDPAGAAGLARLFERIAYRGTEQVGTRDGAAEKKAIAAVEEAYDRIAAERGKGARADEVKLVGLQLELQKAIDAARSFQTGEDVARLLREHGATGLQTTVGADETLFQVSLPSNRAELWFALESQRLTRPLFRNFYDDRDAAVAAYRDQVEAVPAARAMQALAASAFLAHPYHAGTAGWQSDLIELRESAAREFFERHYVPSNIVIAMAGDIGPEEARRLADRYFGAVPARPAPPALHTVEPAQAGPRTVVMEIANESLLAVGYKRPARTDRDDAVLAVIQTLLTGGRQSWLIRELFDDRRLATSVQAFPSYPGGRFPGLFAFLIGVAPGHTTEEAEKAVGEVLSRLQAQKVDETVLQGARAQARAAIVRQLADNSGIAGLLARCALEYGDWRKLFALLDDFGKVTAGQAQIAALRYFQPARRTSVHLVLPPAKGGAQ